MQSNESISTQKNRAPAVIARILELSGPVPDAGAFRRYLASLPAERLHQKCLDLANEAEKPRTEAVRYWPPAGRSAAGAPLPQTPASATF